MADRIALLEKQLALQKVQTIRAESFNLDEEKKLAPVVKKPVPTPPSMARGPPRPPAGRGPVPCPRPVI